MSRVERLKRECNEWLSGSTGVEPTFLKGAGRVPTSNFWGTLDVRAKYCFPELASHCREAIVHCIVCEVVPLHRQVRSCHRLQITLSITELPSAEKMLHDYKPLSSNMDDYKPVGTHTITISPGGCQSRPHTVCDGTCLLRDARPLGMVLTCMYALLTE